MNKFLLVLFISSLVGCSSGISDLAKQGRWQELGFRDGNKGLNQRTPSRLSDWGEESSQSVDYSSYEEGYLNGITEYCNPNYAYQIGLSGQSYNGVCQNTEDSQQFRMEWHRGWSDYNLGDAGH
ncbi:MAG: DUF2799 domain-containing protein [Aliivibrio sp.]|uniref:DUF2799 domain-containing protein n=1 Tax=Aliivibrio sp. TaxID=1872443 RepID=UPI001A478189|nr:DUF2799 domain-containing protein [Aliivibrio sp.]